MDALIIIGAIISFAGSDAKPFLVQKNIPAKTCSNLQRQVKPHIEGLRRDKKIVIHAGPLFKCLVTV